MDGNSEQLQVINLKQLPIIEERLRDVKAKIEQRTSAVMALAVTEETRTDVKKIRTEVRKELEGYEAQRMAVKKAIMTPYEQFEAVYKECVSNPYKAADEALGKKIADVEVGIKQQKEDDVRAFFTELTSGFGLDWLKFEQMNLKVTLTCTPKAMKAAITQSVTKIVRDCAALEENPDRDEIMAEMLMQMVYAIDENPDQDFLGELYMTCELGNDHAGQFFTPYNVCQAMSEISFDPARFEDKGFVSVNDCACGAGALLVSFANACKRHDINYQQKVMFVAQDIDYTVGLMCYILVKFNQEPRRPPVKRWPPIFMQGGRCLQTVRRFSFTPGVGDVPDKNIGNIIRGSSPCFGDKQRRNTSCIRKSEINSGKDRPCSMPAPSWHRGRVSAL